MSDDQFNEPSQQPSKWRVRTEVLLLVIGALVLVIPTVFVFLSGAE
jgi:hypothetical protein